MIAAIVQTGHVTIANLVMYAGVVGAGWFAWRSQRGDFYKKSAEENKAEAEEYKAEAQELRKENTTLRSQRDLTPILDRLDHVTDALKQQTDASNEVFKKVADMNGALRHHGDAMRAQTEAIKALSDRLILDEAARALLATAADRKDTPA